VQYGEQIDVVINGASMIFQQYPDDLGGAVQAARSMGLDGDTERDLVAEIERRFASAAAVEAQQREQTFEAALAAAEAGNFLTAFDNAERAQFTPQQRQDLERINAGIPLVGDERILTRLKSQTAEETANTDLSELLGSLTLEQRDEARRIVDAARKDVNGSNSYEWQGIRTEQVTIDNAITAMGIVSGPNARPADIDNRNDLYLLFEREKRRRLAAGEAWDAQAVSLYADLLNGQVPISEGFLYGVNTAPLWQVLLGKQEIMFVPGVPTDAVSEIRELIKARGLQATPELILQTYLQFQNASD